VGHLTSLALRTGLLAGAGILAFALTTQVSKAIVTPVLDGPASKEVRINDPAKELDCKRYAKQAVKMVEGNWTYGCGLSGPRYTSSYDDHYNWCLTAPDNVVSHEGSMRDAEVASCWQCRIYAKDAIRQFSEAFAKCGNAPVSGPLWEFNTEEVHFGFCFQDRGEGSDPRHVFNPDADAHRDARQADLKQCG